MILLKHKRVAAGHSSPDNRSGRDSTKNVTGNFSVKTSPEIHVNSSLAYQCSLISYKPFWDLGALLVHKDHPERRHALGGRGVTQSETNSTDRLRDKEGEGVQKPQKFA